MLNKAILMGRLVHNPELKITPGGTFVCPFTIAVNRPYSRDKETQTDFIDVVAWRQSAEFVNKYFVKGSMIVVDGTIQTRTYEDRNGNKRKAVEVVANHVEFGESRKSSENRYDAPPPPAEPPVGYSSGSQADFEAMSGDSADLPF